MHHSFEGEEIYRGTATAITGLEPRDFAVQRVYRPAGNESKGSTALLAPTGSSQPGSSPTGDIWTANRVVTVDIESRSATQVCLSHTKAAAGGHPVQHDLHRTSKPGEAVVYATFRDGGQPVADGVRRIQFDNRAPGDLSSRW